MRIFGTRRDQEQETAEGWDTEFWQLEGWISLDRDDYGLFRIKLRRKVPDHLMPKMTQVAKDCAGTWWFAARLWIIPPEAMMDFHQKMKAIEKEAESPSTK